SWCRTEALVSPRAVTSATDGRLTRVSITRAGAVEVTRMSMSFTVSRMRRSEPAISSRSTPPCALSASATCRATSRAAGSDARADLLADARQGPQTAARGDGGDVLREGLQRLGGALPGADAETGLVAHLEEARHLVEEPRQLEIRHPMQFTTRARDTLRSPVIATWCWDLL